MPIYGLLFITSCAAWSTKFELDLRVTTRRNLLVLLIGHNLNIMEGTIIEFILYVADQKRSTDFYGSLLGLEPVLNVPGMTEFQLTSTCKLGLMPESGIAKIISKKAPHPATASGIPRCELYLYVDDLLTYYKRAITLNSPLISALEERDWGDTVCYFSDPDGHIIAFAQKISMKA